MFILRSCIASLGNAPQFVQWINTFHPKTFLGTSLLFIWLFLSSVTPDLTSRLVPLDYYTWVKPPQASKKKQFPYDQIALGSSDNATASLIAPINPMAFPQYDTLLDHFTLGYDLLFLWFFRFSP